MYLRNIESETVWNNSAKYVTWIKNDSFWEITTYKCNNLYLQKKQTFTERNSFNHFKFLLWMNLYLRFN